MDKHNKHHKNKAKDGNKPQSPQLSPTGAQDQIAGKIEETAASGQKSKSAKGKQK